MIVYLCSSEKPGNASRHSKSVKIGASLFIVFLFSYAQFIYLGNGGGPISGYFRYTFYINNLANFFIYLAVDEEFRERFKCRR